MNMHVRKKRGGHFFCSYPIFLFCASNKGTQKKLKDYFVPDSHLFNQWMRTYSGSELWGVLPNFFYQFKGPISILFSIMHKYAFLDILQNPHY